MSEDLKRRFERQVAIALQYANDEKGDKLLPSVFELQVGHLRDIGKEMADALSALREKLAEEKRFHNVTIALLQAAEARATAAEAREANANDREANRHTIAVRHADRKKIGTKLTQETKPGKPLTIRQIKKKTKEAMAYRLSKMAER